MRRGALADRWAQTILAIAAGCATAGAIAFILIIIGGLA